MSKITFRADDDLVERIEALDASKSAVMRDALRAYLDGAERGGVDRSPADPDPTVDDSTDDAPTFDDVLVTRIDELVADRVDELVYDRFGDAGVRRTPSQTPQDVNVNISLDGLSTTDASVDANETTDRKRKTRTDDARSDAQDKTCSQCGELVGADHVYCPNCGEKASHRVFCDCGDEVRSDWAFCPSCGRRTPAADVLDRT